MRERCAENHVEQTQIEVAAQPAAFRNVVVNAHQHGVVAGVAARLDLRPMHEIALVEPGADLLPKAPLCLPKFFGAALPLRFCFPAGAAGFLPCRVEFPVEVVFAGLRSGAILRSSSASFSVNMATSFSHKGSMPVDMTDSPLTVRFRERAWTNRGAFHLRNYAVAGC